MNEKSRFTGPTRFRATGQHYGAETRAARRAESKFTSEAATKKEKYKIQPGLRLALIHLRSRRKLLHPFSV